MKKNRFSKLYTLMIAVALLLAVTTVSFGAIDWDGTFRYNSIHAGYCGYSNILVKSDDSSAVVAFDASPSPDATLFVEIWGSQQYASNYVNHTLRHIQNGLTVAYYTVKPNQQAYIPNLVYETYKMSAFTKLKLYTSCVGLVQGRWDSSTR